MTTVRKLMVSGLVGLLLTACATTEQGGRVLERLPEKETVTSAPVAPPPPPVPQLTREELVRLAKQGLHSDSLIARIKETRTRMRLTATDVFTLKTQGVPLTVLDFLMENDRLASADDCTAQINRRDEEARQREQKAVQQAEMSGWQRCQLHYPMFPQIWQPFPQPYPHRRR